MATRRGFDSDGLRAPAPHKFRPWDAVVARDYANNIRTRTAPTTGATLPPPTFT